jgi:dipeptidase E
VAGQLFLSGGGGAEDSSLLDRAFAETVGPGPVWYWPVAMFQGDHDYGACLEWFTGIFAPLGLTEIQMWDGTGAPGELTRRLSQSRAVYIGGGNTFRLLSIVKQHGLLDPLRAFAANGGAVYGGSAGAAFLGADITTVAHLDTDPHGTDDTHALDVVAGHGVFVHYEPQDIRHVDQWRSRHGRPVVALHERAGAVIADNRLTAVGFESVQLIGDETRVLGPGSSIELPSWRP